MPRDTAAFVACLPGRSLLEYLIYGALSYRSRTFATPVCNTHNRDPHVGPRAGSNNIRSIFDYSVAARPAPNHLTRYIGSRY